MALIPQASGIPKTENSPITTDLPSQKMSQKDEPVATASSTMKQESPKKETKLGAQNGATSSKATTTATLGKQKKNDK